MSDEIMIQENPEAAPVEEAPVQAVEQPAEEAAPAVEAEAAPAEKSFDEMLEDSLKTIYNGDKVSGVVVAITPTEVSIDLGHEILRIHPHPPSSPKTARSSLRTPCMSATRSRP